MAYNNREISWGWESKPVFRYGFLASKIVDFWTCFASVREHEWGNSPGIVAGLEEDYFWITSSAIGLAEHSSECQLRYTGFQGSAARQKLKSGISLLTRRGMFRYPCAVRISSEITCFKPCSRGGATLYLIVWENWQNRSKNRWFSRLKNLTE